MTATDTRIVSIEAWRALSRVRGESCGRDDDPSQHDRPRLREPEWLRRRRTVGLPAKDYTGSAA